MIFKQNMRHNYLKWWTIKVREQTIENEIQLFSNILKPQLKNVDSVFP